MLSGYRIGQHSPRASSPYGSESAEMANHLDKIMGGKSFTSNKSPHFFEALLKLKLWNFAHSLYPLEPAVDARAERTIPDSRPPLW